MIDVDQHVASRLRARRRALGLTLDELAEVGGLELQKLHGYEVGSDRISAASLWRLAQALDVEPSYFFLDLPAESAVDRAPEPRAFAGPAPTSH